MHLKAHARAHAHAASSQSYDYEYTAGERTLEKERENGPGESVGEQIGLSNQRDGSRGLPTTAHWPGSRVRYRIIAGNSTGIAVTIHRCGPFISDSRSLVHASLTRRFTSAIDLTRDISKRRVKTRVLIIINRGRDEISPCMKISEWPVT